MTAKEEANRIANRFYQGSVFDYDKEGHLKERKKAKERALICVDELLNTVPYVNNTPAQVRKRIYYMDVRSEINKL